MLHALLKYCCKHSENTVANTPKMLLHTLQKWGCTQPYTSVARNPKKVFCTLLKCCCNRTSGFSRNNKISRITIFAKITTSYFHKDCQIHQMYRNQLKSPDSPKFQDSPISHNSPESQSKHNQQIHHT